MKKIIAFTIGALVASPAFAFFPPLSPEAQAAADLKKAKTAYAGKVGAFKLCQVQNKIADQYKVSGTPAPAACVAPPPFVAPVAAAASAAK
ncbi:hypothetical protein [Polynucleobacter necessarius]|uniref:hypothetical protein n=1 Tax=Polynucleobacter necessarius TaxID=576610 RepID=UPI000E0920D9|nr:hypothetical protein [Polynucleobacter necessarius]